MLSKRVRQLAPSPTLSLDAKVKELQAAGRPIISLALGEPDFATPTKIKQAGITAINQNFTHYTATAGIPELRNAIVQKLARENQLTYSPSEVVIGVGTKQLLYHAFQVLCDKGDEV